MAGSRHIPTCRAACCSLLPSCKSRTNRALLHNQQLRGSQSQHSAYDANQIQRVWETWGHQSQLQGDQERSLPVLSPTAKMPPCVSGSCAAFQSQKIPPAGPGAPVQPPRVPVPGVGAQGGHHKQRSFHSVFCLQLLVTSNCCPQHLLALK